MRRIPIIPTLLVALAILVMIMLGLWQIDRARWKQALLASYRAGAAAPALSGLPPGMATDRLAFRRAEMDCRLTTAPIQLGGTNSAGRTGFRNIAGCALPDGRTIMVDLGWAEINAKPSFPGIGSTIESSGLLIPDEVLARRVLPDVPKVLPLLLVLDHPAPGLLASRPPAIESIPNNHLGYAGQWFLFAAVAGLIYALALRKRVVRG